MNILVSTFAIDIAVFHLRSSTHMNREFEANLQITYNTKNEESGVTLKPQNKSHDELILMLLFKTIPSSASDALVRVG